MGVWPEVPTGPSPHQIATMLVSRKGRDEEVSCVPLLVPTSLWRYKDLPVQGVQEGKIMHWESGVLPSWPLLSLLTSGKSLHSLGGSSFCACLMEALLGLFKP